MDIAKLARPALAAGAIALALALNAGAQATTAAGSKTAATGASSGTAAPTAKPPAQKHHKHHASAQGGHSHSRSMGAGSPMSEAQMGYQAALRHCVEGPSAQRDGCLDAAISRFGRT